MTGLVRVLSANEPWAEYQLEDGTLLRFRFSACSFRQTGKRTEQGDLEYTFSQQVQCETHAAPVVAEVRQLPRLVADSALAEGFTLSGDPEPINDRYVAPDSDCG